VILRLSGAGIFGGALFQILLKIRGALKKSAPKNSLGNAGWWALCSEQEKEKG
jgi:hypothetical protein